MLAMATRSCSPRIEFCLCDLGGQTRERAGTGGRQEGRRRVARRRVAASKEMEAIVTPRGRRDAATPPFNRRLTAAAALARC